MPIDPKKTGKKPVRTFRLKPGAGPHQCPDPNWKCPTREEYEETNPGMPYPPKPDTVTISPGGRVKTTEDLIAKFGEAKFEELGVPVDPETPGDVAPVVSGAFPGGQVSTGFQETSGSAPKPTPVPESEAPEGATKPHEGETSPGAKGKTDGKTQPTPGHGHGKGR